MEEKENIRALFIRLAEGAATSGEKERIREYLLDGGVADDLPMPDELAPGPEMTAAEADRVFETVVATRPARYRRMNWGRLAAAAVLIGVIACAGLYWFLRQPPATIITAHAFTGKSVQLEDGTIVRLKAGSVLKIAGDFGEKRREVEITGAAYFSVKPGANRPFIVHTPHLLDVEVLGTEFNVDARGEKARVVLTRGSVKVQVNTVKQLHELVLRPGEMADFDPARKTLSRSEADTLLYADWKEDVLTFRNAPLTIVTQRLKEEFGQELRFADTSLQHLVFTGYLSSADIRIAIKTLEQTFDLQAQRINQNTILVQKKTK